MTSQQPLLSVCIPTYNRADWLRVCLMGLTPMMQKVGVQVEVVVSDNCSPDNGQTTKVVKEIQKHYPVRYHRHESNIGGNPNIMFTVSQLARGEYAWVIGDDDVPCNDSVQRILAALQERPQLDFVYVNHLVYDGPHPLGGDVAPGSVTVYNPDFEDRLLPRLGDVLPAEANCFTAIYGFVLRRSLAAEAFQVAADAVPFSTAETVVPHAMFIINNLLDQPVWYLGQPGLIASAAISWQKYRAQYGLVLMHDLYDLLEANGIDSGIIETMRRQRLRYAGNLLWEMLTDPNCGHRDAFSLWEYQKRHGRYPEVWQTMSELVQHANSISNEALKNGALKQAA